MGISQTTSAVLVFLAGLLPASCHKVATQQKSAPPAVAAAGTNAVNSANRNLGEISLTNHSETCLLLDPSKSCTITPRLLDKHDVQITLSVESKNDYGETSGFAVTQVTAQPGKPLEIAVGGFNLTFTPKVFDQ
jgi:hypothetical protein